MRRNQQVKAFTSIKKVKGKPFLFSDEICLSKFISSIRQPIESLFNWIQEKTNVQNPPK